VRGQIFWARLPQQTNQLKHSVEWGYRPVVVVSSEKGNTTSSIVMIAPITTKIKPLSCNVNISWSATGQQSQVLCNQIMTMPKALMEHPRGQLTDDEMEQVNKAICISLGIGGIYDSKCEYVKRGV